MSGLVRICPTCGGRNAPEDSFCTCGTLLADVDFTPEAVAPAAPAEVSKPLPETPAEHVTPVLAPPSLIATSLICPHADCGQPNPAGATRCVYCDRPLAAPAPQDELQFRLPASLRGHFRLLSPLPGVGGQADVWLALDGQGVQRVIKLYRHGMTPDWQVLGHLPEVNCPHVVQVLAHGEAEGVAFEVTEYCAGGDVRALLAHWPLPDALLRELLQQVTETLAALHARHILHRDLKPENLLLRTLTPLDVVLIDFGASSLKMATQYFTKGARTAHYAAPEVLTGVLDEKSDWWSLGMVLLEALRGRHPFEGLSEQIALHQLATQAVEVSGVVDARWRMLCRGLLLRNPAQRWGAEEVRRWLAGDDSLSVPEDRGTGVAVRPYVLLKAECRTRADLALALAKHWEEGKKDVRRGAVLQWVEQELRDTNLARDIDDARQMESVSDDVRLLHVILRTLPGMPPVWRGKVITRNMLLRAATQQNFPEGLHWLGTLYDEQVLEILAGYGNQEMGEVAGNWRADVQRYQALWARAKELEADGHREQAQDVDYLLYLAPLRMNRPELRDILPEPLLARYASAHADSVRQAVLGASSAVDCSWLNRWLAEIGSADALAWFVAQRLLPFAREDAQHEAGSRAQSARQAQLNLLAVFNRLEQDCEDFLQFSDLGALTHRETEALRQQTNAWIEQMLWLQNLAEAESVLLRHVQGQMKQMEAEVQGLRNFLGRHEALLAVNHIWLQPNRVFLGLTILFSLWAFNHFLGGVLLLLGIAFGYWRWQETQTSDSTGMARLRRVLNLVQQFRQIVRTVRERAQEAGNTTHDT